jgi:type IV secretory pathway VirB4 component
MKKRKTAVEKDFVTKPQKDFLDMITPSVVKFYTDYFICGNTFRCVWALREYPTSTSEQAILRYLGEKDGVTLRIYTRHVTAVEEKRIISNAANKNRMQRSSTNNLQQSIAAESNLQDVAQLAADMHRNREPLLHVAVFIEMISDSLDNLRILQTEVQTELVRSKLNVDKLMLRQQHGFMSVMPSGRNMFKEQFERVIPASSTANLYPFSFSGKTDEQGFYLGKDRYGGNIIVDFDKRDDDKTNSNALILGNSGQGKSYLLKLILTNLREKGKHIVCLDPELEFAELTLNLGGCFIDLMSGEYIINVLEPKTWDDGSNSDEDVPQAFKSKTKLSQHISFLRDFFRSYKDFSDREIDTIELLLIKLYAKFNISDDTDWNSIQPTDYPILSDFYALVEAEYQGYNPKQKNLYTAETLQNICLGLHSLCKGAESKFFDGHTNITDGNFVTFGVKGLLQASKNIRNALLFNVLSYMSEQLLTKGNTVASIDEFYLMLNNLTAVEYVRNFMKRVRKKESAVIISSQNIEDFLVENVRELTKPLFAIPIHQFLFNAGTVDSAFYMDALQLEPSEYKIIQYPHRGMCLYKCGNERYCLCVIAPPHKAKLFGKAGGR